MVIKQRVDVDRWSLTLATLGEREMDGRVFTEDTALPVFPRSELGAVNAR